MSHSDPRMGSFDAVMFGIEEDPLLRSVIVLVTVLDREPDPEVVSDRAERMTRLYPKLRQRPVGNPLSLAPPRWETDPNFDFDYHLRWRRLPEDDGGLPELLHYAERLSEQDFDRSRPLWEVVVITGMADGKAAFVIKISHAITDGMGGMEMGAAMLDLGPDPADLGPMPPAPEPHRMGLLDRLGSGVGFEISQVIGEVGAVAGLTTAGAKATLRDPLGSALTAAEFTASAARMLAPQGDPLSSLMTGRSLSVVFTVLQVPLADLVDAAGATGTTLNNVFVSAVAGGLRAYHRAHHSDLTEFRINMPISVRTDDDAPDGNRWVPARFVLPVGPDDPKARMILMHPVLRRAQHDPALHLSSIVYRLLTALPRPITTAVAGSLMKGVDVAATNVPGPPVEVYLAGAKVELMVPFAPKAGAAVNIALMSYREQVYLGINCDPAAVTDPQELTECIRAALDEVIEVGRQFHRPD